MRDGAQSVGFASRVISSSPGSAPKVRAAAVTTAARQSGRHSDGVPPPK
jgi:hypothetical protein